MNGILVDSNVIIDILTQDREWYSWSSEQLASLGNRHILFINKIIYAEISISFRTIEDLENTVSSEVFRRSRIPWEAAFLAGKVFLKYKRAGGDKSAPLPDFLIGAHAAIDDLTLLTRDSNRYRYYFPKLSIISPKNQHAQ